MSFGSFGRKTAQIEQGGVIGSNLDYYFTANVTNDNGWADHNSSQLRQAFGKLRYTDADTTISLSMGGADNELNGTQTIPRSFLDNRQQAYTFPDHESEPGRLSDALGRPLLHAEHPAERQRCTTATYRNTNTSSNVNDDFGEVEDDGDVDMIQATNEQVGDRRPTAMAAACNSRCSTSSSARTTSWSLGAAGDFANSHFTQAVAGRVLHRYARDGRHRRLQSDRPMRRRATRTGASTSRTRLSLTEQWSMTLAGRYNWAKAVIGDESGVQPLLDGNHTFSRFNPAIGFNWNPTPAFTAYATYNEGMRSPTAIELACADPAAPCSLPNDFIADPDLAAGDLEDVRSGRARTDRQRHDVERGRLQHDARQRHPVRQQQGAASTLGFFQNVGKTRRQGLELAGRTQVRAARHCGEL